MKDLRSIQKVILSILFFSFISMCKAQGQYHINGTLQGLTNGKIYIQKIRGSDPITVTDGKFEISGNLKESVEKILLRKTPDSIRGALKDYFTIYVEPGKMELIMNYFDFSNGKVVGSKTQEENDKYISFCEKIALKYKKEVEYYEAVGKKYDDAEAAGLSEKKLEELMYKQDKAKKKLAPMFKEFKQMTLNFIMYNPKSYITGDLLFGRLTDFEYNEVRTYYDNLNVSYKNSRNGKELAAEIEKMKKGIIGSAAYPFNTIDIDESPIKLQDFRGQYLLINFWASECVPCRKRNSDLLKIYSQYKSKGLEILGVSDDDKNESAWKKAVKKDKIGIWRHVLRGRQYNQETHNQIYIDQDIGAQYNIYSLPTKVLVDPEGIIIGKYVEGQEDNKKLKEDLAAIFSAKKIKKNDFAAIGRTKNIRFSFF